MFDVYAPLKSLPRIFGTAFETIPAKVPYLKAEPELVSVWRDRLPPKPGWRVGLCWQGSQLNRGDRRRSIPLQEFKPCLESADDQVITVQLDVVVTVDTAIKHLAGALGVSTFLLLKCTPDWRWLGERNDSPWCPAMRLLRQNALGSWANVIGALSSTDH